MFKCAKTTCFRPVDNGGLHCRKHDLAETLQMVIIFAALAVLIYFLSGSIDGMSK